MRVLALHRVIGTSEEEGIRHDDFQLLNINWINEIKS